MNGQETEAKFYVRDLSKIETRLHELKADLIQPRVHETNLRFDTAGRDLRSAGRVLRLRQDNQARMTYKGPSGKTDGVISREEIEFVVEDFERAKRFFQALGYQVMVFYEKYRISYELDNTHIMLDELPYGDFVEIEGEDVSSIQKMANRLGLGWDSAIAKSYHALFERVADDRKLDKSQLSFDVFKGGKPSPEELGIIEAD